MNSNVFFRSSEASAVDLHDGAPHQHGDCGTRTKQVSLTQPFDRLCVNGPIQVVFNFSEGHSVVEINAEQQHLDAIELKIDDSTLHVSCSNDPEILGQTTFLVKVKHPTLREAALHGSGDLLIHGVDQDQLSVHLHDAGCLDIEGFVDWLDMNLQGSGNIDSTDLECNHLTALLQGSGSIRANSNESAIVELNGSGDVRVYGAPSVQKRTVKGSGHINIE